MNKQLSIALLVIVIVAIFAAGFFAGSAKGPAVVKGDLVEQLTSAPVVSIVAYGKVAAIDAKKITLDNQGQQLTLGLANNVAVSGLSVPAGTQPSGQPTALSPNNGVKQLSDVAVGSSVSATLKVAADGSVSVISIILMPDITAAAVPTGQ